MSSPPYPLTNSDWKTRRAKKHIDELKEMLASLTDPNSQTVTVDEDTARKAVTYRVTFQQPHVWTYLIAGDIFQCLRTALDQAVWDLASWGKPDLDPCRTQFPIFATDDDDAKKRIASYTSGISDKARDVIKSLQPYNRPKGLPANSCLLWQLHEINRIDKHRRITVNTFGVIVTSPMVVPLIPVDDGYEITLPSDLVSTFEPQFSPQVRFGDPDSCVTIETIEQIYQLVTWKILPSLAGCFQ